MKKEINYKALAEQLFIERLVTEVHPTGIVSLVSDTFNLWDVLTISLPALKDKILARDGGEESLDKVVIRPDSGNPTDILCGDPNAPEGSPASKGVVELLYETFGGDKTEQGYITLNPAVGAIYGDAITIDRCQEICDRLKAKGFASTNVVYGIGSFTYQHITRDSLGFAMKATSVTIDGVERPIFKDPITDDGTKKSAKGRVSVFRNVNGELQYSDTENPNMMGDNLLTTIFEDGKLLKEVTLNQIRERLS